MHNDPIVLAYNTLLYCTYPKQTIMSKRTKQVEVPEQLKGINLLPREERISLTKQLIAEKPKVLGPLAPLWWWWEPCEVNVLIVTDTGLDFGLGAFGLSEFLTSFKKLEDQSCTNIKYKVTVAQTSLSIIV